MQRSIQLQIWLLFLILFSAMPLDSAGEISVEMKSLLLDPGSTEAETQRILRTAAATPAGAAAVYEAVLEEVSEPLGRLRLNQLCRVIVAARPDHAELMRFSRGLPDESRLLGSLVLGSHLLTNADQVSGDEFREAEEVLIGDLGKFVGRDDARPLIEMMNSIAREYYGRRAEASAAPDVSYSTLRNGLCRSYEDLERTCFAGALAHLGHAGTEELFCRELQGRGCLGTPCPVTSRIMLSHLVKSSTGARRLAEILPAIDDADTYAMAIRVARLNEDLLRDLAFHQAVLADFERRLGEFAGHAESRRPDRPLESTPVGMRAYLRAAWPRLAEALHAQPQALAGHAPLLARMASEEQILTLAERAGRGLQEPYLSVFVERFVSGNHSPDRLATLLEFVGSDRLPMGLRQRAETRAATSLISIKHRSIVRPEPTNQGPGRDAGESKR